jgi:hypothetical protein
MAYAWTKDTVYTTGTGDGFATAIYALKTALVAAGWTVPSSGSGTSGSYSSSTDLITSAAVLNSAKAWFRIKMPSSTREWCFQRTTSDMLWRVKVAPGGFLTGSPAKDVTPLGATEYVMLGSGTDASPTGANFPLTNATSLRTQIACDGASPYGAVMVTHQAGTVNKECAWFTDPMVTGTFDASDTDPYVYGMNCASASAMLDVLLATETTSQCAVFSGLTPTQVIAPIYSITSDGSTYYTAIPAGIGTNHISGYDDLFPVMWHRRSALAGGIGGQKGYSGLFLWLGTAKAVGSTCSVSTTSDRYVFGHVNLPWDGTTPNV